MRDETLPLPPPHHVPDASGVRVIALADLHTRSAGPGPFPRVVRELAASADVILLCGDLTDNSRPAEFVQVASAWGAMPVPVIAVMGNHDRRNIRRIASRTMLTKAGIRVLDGESCTITTAAGVRVGIVGLIGTGGGFGEEVEPSPVTAQVRKAISAKARRAAHRLDAALARLTDDEPEVTLVAMHYAPTRATLGREPAVRHWMLGNRLYEQVLDRYRVDAIFHGHAHLGALEGETRGGVPVRNVAVHVAAGVHLFHVQAGRKITSAAYRPYQAPEYA